MQQRIGARRPPFAPGFPRLGARHAVLVGLALLCSVVLPVIPIFVGVFLVLGVGLHVGLPELRPYLDTLLRVPVGRPATRRTRLVVEASAGVLLVLIGSASATFRGQLRSEWRQDQEQRAHVDEQVSGLLARARSQLSSGAVGAAELTLLEADAIIGIDAESRAQVDDLLERVRRSGIAR